MDKQFSIALCRVSTKEQMLKGHSLTRQDEIVRAAALELGAPIKKAWSIDRSSRSGKNLNRKDLEQMMRFCREDRSVKYLIVDEVDRFMRSIDEFYYFEVSFRKLGVTVWYAGNPGLNGATLEAKVGKLLEILKAEMSNTERITKSTNGLRARVRLGYYPFPVPQGYKKTGVPGLFEPDGETFSLLQGALRDVLAGMPPAAALKRLNGRGYRTPGGKPLYLNRFMCILRCPYYAGAIRIRGWDFANERALHEPMVSLEEFETLQLILSGKKLKTPRKRHNPEYPLSNLLECAGCGRRLVGFTHRNGRGGCWGKYRCRGCKKQHRRENVHAAVSAALGGVTLAPAVKEQLLESLEAKWQKEEAEGIEHARLLGRRREGLLEEKRKYLVALAENPNLREDYRRVIQEVEGRIADLDAQAGGAGKAGEGLADFTRFALNFLEYQKERWWELGHADLARCKQLLFPRGFSISPEGVVYTPEISPIFRLGETKTTTPRDDESCLVDLTEKSLHPFALDDELFRWMRELEEPYKEYREERERQRRERRAARRRAAAERHPSGHIPLTNACVCCPPQ